MPVVVVGANADDRDLRLNRIEERIGRRRAAAVVGDLQDVDVAADARPDTSRNQLGIDLLLGVASKDHRPAAVVQLEHERGVVDLLAILGRERRD